MISLFNDLLNLSVIESQNSVRSELFSLSSSVEFITESIKTNYPKKKIEIITDFNLETIKGDPRLIEQVLSNLIDNACRYSGPGDLEIKIESKATATKALISVSDNGPGIAKEYLQRIFERFYRIESSREISRGTGLGLSIVKHIIAKHGGRIWAESDGMGTVFTIELPLEDVL